MSGWCRKEAYNDEDKGIHMRIRSEYVLRKNGARWITEKTT